MGAITASAFAVLEVAAEGAHLYGLIDLVRGYAVGQGGEAHYDALIDRAATWYQQQDRNRFVAFVEDDEYARQLTQRPGARNLGAAHMFILPARRVPEWLERLHEVTAPRGVPRAATVPDESSPLDTPEAG